MKTKIKPFKATKRHARKIIELVNQGLCAGLGSPAPGQMCVEAAVCFAFGLPHSDDPPCVGAAVRGFKIILNDSPLWGSNLKRGNGMRRLAIAQLGSDKLDQEKFAALLALEISRQLCWSTGGGAALPVAVHAGVGAVIDAADAVIATAMASAIVAEGTNSAAYADAAADAAANRILCKGAEIAVQVLIAMKCEGTKWLDLAPLS